MSTTPEDTAGAVHEAMSHAFNLGQTYWQQADSEYTSHHRKADATREKFNEVREQALAAVQRALAAQPDDTGLLFRALNALTYHREQTRPIEVTDRVIDALHARLAAPQQAAPAGQAAAPHGWLYDWTHSSATGRPDERFTGFTTSEDDARRHPSHENVRAVYLQAPAAEAVQPQAVRLTDEILRAEFAKLYPQDDAILHLAENNRDFMLEAIGARHHWRAFREGARAAERAVWAANGLRGE